jgi:putative ABC transport system permease protein
MIRHHRLIWAGIWRNTTRTSYTLLSIMVAFLLFGLLQGVTSAFQNAAASANLDRLYVDSRFGLARGLPMSYLQRIEQIEGVTAVAYASWFGGSFQESKQSIFSLAIDPQRYLAIYDEIKLPPEQLRKMIQTRDGAVISRKLAERFDWKIGDRVPLLSGVWALKANGSSIWSFEIVGIFEPDAQRTTRSEFLLNHTYFDEARAYKNGTVGWYVARTADPAQSIRTAAAIDALFANSSDETLTQDEQEKAQSLLKEHGDINLIVNLIMGAVFFTLLLLTGNTMMQSVRDRIPEFAVLKTLGYSNTTVSTIILSEALAICVVAAAAGLGLAWLLYPLLQTLTAAPRMPPWVPIDGLLIAAVLAAVTGLPSAVRLRRINVVDALAGR